MLKHPSFLIATSLLAGALLLQSGCAQQCKQVSSDYQRALTNEGQLTAVDEAQPTTPTTHVGVGVRLNLLSTVAQNLISKQLGQELNFLSKMPLGGGKVVDVAMEGDALNLKFEQDKACPTCFRLGGNLGGTLAVTVPILGKQKIPLGGSLKLVAPIVFETDTQNVITIRFDTQKFADYAQSAIDLQLDGLPSSVATAIRQPLTKKIMTQLSSKLKPVKLFSFKSPDFGIAGMRVMPAEMAFHPKNNAIFIGFNTNLPGLEEAGGLTALTALDFADGENLAVALQPAVLKSAISLLMKDGKIPRRYTTDGKASESGPAHVTLNTVRIVNGRGGKGQSQGQPSGGKSTTNQDLDVGFRAWNLLGAACFWFDALVTGDITLKDSNLAVNLRDVKLIKSSAPGIVDNLVKNLVNWKTSEFIGKTQELLNTTLSKPNITIPGMGNVQLSLSSLAKDNNTLVLRSGVLMKAMGSK